MVKMLASRELVTYEKYGYVTLTEKGRKIADQLRNKNDVIKNFLIKYLGVDEKTAIDDAYRIKNTLSDNTFAKLKKFIYFLENRPDQQNINYPQEVEGFSKK
jgi:DtxR family Mn-dependent transcriptional regulator